MENPLEVLLPLLRRPLLTADEERQLARRMRQGGLGAIEARERLIESNVGLVIKIARSFRNKRFTEDLIAEGMVGLMRAVERFDPEKGFRFSTYATHWIVREILNAVDNFYNDRNVARLPAYITDILRRLDKLVGKSPELENNVEALMVELGVKRKPIEELLSARKGGLTALSLSAPATPESTTLLEELVSEKEAEDESTEVFDALLGRLTEQEEKILRLHYLEGKKFWEIADELHLSKSNVNRICNSAKRKLRKKFPMTAKAIPDL